MNLHPNIGLLFRMFLFCKECNKKTWHDLYGNSVTYEYRCEYHVSKDGAPQKPQNSHCGRGV